MLEIDILKAFSRRLVEMLDKAKFPPPEAGRYSLLAQRFNVSRTQPYRWANGEAIPSPEVLCRMADEFGVTTDWLLGRIDIVVSVASQVPVFRADASAQGQLYRAGSVFMSPSAQDGEESRVVIVAPFTCVDSFVARTDAVMVDRSCAGGLQSGKVYAALCRGGLMLGVMNEAAGKYTLSCVWPDQSEAQITLPENQARQSFCLPPDTPIAHRGSLLLGRVVATALVMDPAVLTWISPG